MLYFVDISDGLRVLCGVALAYDRRGGVGVS